jgi:hypothetical protein
MIAATIARSTVGNRDGADLISMDHSASALRTSDWEIPKCRAIRDGVTPALKAARSRCSRSRLRKKCRPLK